MKTRLTRAPRGDDNSPGSGGIGSLTAGGSRGLSRRATLRPEIRAAIALEEAGELQEAARVFEYAGAHAQAAILRLEYARTLREPGERLDVLREGCARNPGNTPEGRTLHLAMAETLLVEAEAVQDTAKRRSLELEAARALEEAQEGARAGELYEQLGLLRRAAVAYERSGEVARLEVVLEVIEHQEKRAAAARNLEREVDDALAQGRRRYAHTLLTEHTRSEDGPPPAGLLACRQQVEAKLLRRDRVDLAWRSKTATRQRIVAIRGANRFVIGRAPDADMSLPGARLSRHHVELRVAADAERPRLVAVDLGSRVGTFWQGEPLVPGEPQPLEVAGELGLGMTASALVHPVRSKEGATLGGLVRATGAQTDDTQASDEHWYLFLPGGGPLWLAPGIQVPARILFDRGYVVLDLAATVRADLGDEQLDPGAAVELMIGDRVQLHAAPLVLEALG